MEAKMEYFPFWLRYIREWRDFGLTKEQIATIVFAAGDYMEEGILPDFTDDLMCKIIWTYVRKDLDHAQANYANKVAAGKVSAEKRARKKKEAVSPEAEQTAADLQHDAAQDEQKSRITKTKTESKTKTKTKSKSISKTKSTATSEAKAEAPSKARAGEKDAPRSYGKHEWIALTDEEYQLLCALMGEKMLDHYIMCLDRYVEGNQNAAKYRDWKEVLLNFYNNKWYHSSLPSG